MDGLTQFSLEFTRWLQENYPQLEGFFQAITTLGNEEFYLAALPLLYWCIDKRLGRQMGFIFFVAIGANTILKQAFRGPRPFWIAPELGLADTGGYGIPSGHTQYATTIYLLIAAVVQHFWGWLVAFIMIFLMAISRVYLGQHFIHDTIAGILVGLALLGALALWNHYAAASFGKRLLGQRMLAVLGVVFALGLAYASVRYVIGQPDLTVPWSSYIPEAELSSITQMATALGTLLGFGVGILFEGNRVRFRTDGPVGKRLGRYLLGIVGTIVIWQGLGALFPRDPLWLALPLRIFRYALVTFWAAYLAPLVFVRLGLAEADPPPSMSLRF